MPKIPHRCRTNAVTLKHILLSVEKSFYPQFTEADKNRMENLGEFLETEGILRHQGFSEYAECTDFNACRGIGHVKKIRNEFFVDCSECYVLGPLKPEKVRKWIFDTKRFLELVKKAFSIKAGFYEISDGFYYLGNKNGTNIYFSQKFDEASKQNRG